MLDISTCTYFFCMNGRSLYWVPCSLQGSSKHSKRFIKKWFVKHRKKEKYILLKVIVLTVDLYDSRPCMGLAIWVFITTFKTFSAKS